MKKRKNILYGAVGVLLLVCAFFMLCPKKNVYSLDRIIKDENTEDIKMSIYYVEPWILTRRAWDENVLMRNCEEIITVSGEQLKAHAELFCADVAVRRKKSSYKQARIYYVIESEKNGKLLDVVMWGAKRDTVFVNGEEVEHHDAFYELVLPFLPEDIAIAVAGNRENPGMMIVPEQK